MILKPHSVIHYVPTANKDAASVRILGHSYSAQTPEIRCQIYPLKMEEVLTLSDLSFKLPHMLLCDDPDKAISVGDFLVKGTRYFKVMGKPATHDINNAAKHDALLLEEIIYAPNTIT